MVAKPDRLRDDAVVVAHWGEPRPSCAVARPRRRWPRPCRTDAPCGRRGQTALVVGRRHAHRRAQAVDGLLLDRPWGALAARVLERPGARPLVAGHGREPMRPRILAAMGGVFEPEQQRALTNAAEAWSIMEWIAADAPDEEFAAKAADADVVIGWPDPA